MTVVRIETMEESHLDAVLPFERELFGRDSWSRNSYRAELADHELRHYVVALGAGSADGPDLLGWGGVLVVAEAAEILTVGVVPAARRTGVARRMLAVLLGEAARRGAREVFLEVRVDNAAARTLYASEGFAELGLRRGYYDAGRVDAVTMRKELGGHEELLR